VTDFARLQNKKTKLVVGLMSGTSADGIDAALVSITGNGTSTRLRELAFATFPYPRGLRELVLKSSLPGTGSVDLICELNVLIAHCFADAVKKIVRKGHVILSSIDLIGSHGQTMHHLPKQASKFGKLISSTLQVGDPSTIAKLTGVPTVGDFRTGDMALGGQGAPLVPYFDYLMFRSVKKNRILLNLGGIANFTALPRGCNVDDIIAFDTGPANMVVDALMMKHFGKRYDSDGEVALSGSVDEKLLNEMMRHPYFRQRPPKSTGREVFGSMFFPRILKHQRRLSSRDLIATATQLAPYSVYDQYNRFVKNRMKVDELLVSGGGVHNRAMMKALHCYFAPADVRNVESLGFSSDAKEAICFAVLANETISENASNVPGVTGAGKRAILGKICL